MKDLAILMPCWKSPELLAIAIPSLIKASKSNHEIIVILNEADTESIHILDELNIHHIDLGSNIGPSSVDYAIPYIEKIGFKYVANVNSDMLFSDGWDIELIKLLESNYPCSTSACLVEPIYGGQQVYDTYDFFDVDSHEKFNEAVIEKKYDTTLSDSYNHPILCVTSDFLSVNGYSDGLDQVWIDNKGRALDDYFAYRLYKLHNNNFKFIKSNKSFVYHAVSLNSKKLNLNYGNSGVNAFKDRAGIALKEFYSLIEIK